MNVSDYLDAVRAIYREHGGESPHRLKLRRPAEEHALAAAEEAIGGPLHPELRALWRTTGGSDGAPVFHDGRYLFGYALLSVEQALEQRSYFAIRAPQYDGTVEGTDPRDPRVGDSWLSAGWLPFAAEYDHAVLLVDHRPLGVGSPGQVIRYIHDPDHIDYVCESIAELLPLSIRAIQADPLEFLAIF